MLPTYYQYSTRFAVVQDQTDFFRTSKQKEIFKVKALVEAVKLSLALPTDRVILEVGEGETIYRITALTPDSFKSQIGQFVYIPDQARLDIFSSESSGPVIQWIRKKPVYKSYSMLFDMMGVHTVFAKLSNVL